MVLKKTITILTEKDFTNITKYVHDFLEDSGLADGIINVYSQHTTACIKIMENEILSLCDINEHLESLAPKNKLYKHDLIGLRDVPVTERINGHSHVKTLYFQTSETIPFSDGKLSLGQWQTIMLVELDPVRERNVIITIIGE